MMGDLKFLIRNRERPASAGRLIRVWAKRIYHLPALVQLLLRPMLLRGRGADIGDLVILGHAKIAGTFRNLSIGRETSLGRCEIALHDRVTIGERVVVNDGAVILTASHSLSRSDWAHKKAPITICDYAWIATGAILLPGVTIGRGAVVGAGAVVRGDVPDFTVVAGNPAVPTGACRTAQLDYSPVMLNAPFEAWIGPGTEQSDRTK